MIKNAVLLAGGSGTRCLPFTNVYSKQLLFLAGKAVIDYPIKTLVDLGVESITIILGSFFSGQIVDYCGDGEKYGVRLNYIYQKEPEGISQAINLCERFLKTDDKFYVILGDNIFENPVKLSDIQSPAKIFLINDADLSRFGVASIDNLKIVKIREKPKLIDTSISNYVITGLYQFDHKYFSYFSKTVKSYRREYEICDIHQAYLDNNELDYQIIDGAWSDAGTVDKLKELNCKMGKI